jgi:ADP-ribosylglycohydrolase
MEKVISKKDKEHFAGCLLGGAIGDALGWLYSQQGVADLDCEENGKAKITDDTQLTLFTAEGLLRAETRRREKGACYPPSVVYYAYLRWLHTQGYPQDANKSEIYNGFLIKTKELHVSRSPGKTSISALLSGKYGKLHELINDSKGCGGVKRVAPVGLYTSGETAFELGCECAALTHGHPSGYLAAGVFAHIITALITGLEPKEAILEALDILADYQDYEECNRSIRQAIKLAQSDQEPAEAVKLLGEGKVAEEALAIAVYLALKYSTDFKKAICTAVDFNGGSSKTVAALTGNILGAYLGMRAIPAEWIEKVELKEVILQIADDLLLGYKGTLDWWHRYPGY